MNKLLIVFAIILFSAGAFAQEYQVDFNNSADNKVALSLSHGDIKITGYDGNKVLIKSDEVYEKPERAKGLKSLYNSAEDNTGLGLSVVKEGNTVKIVNASREGGDYEIRIPKKVAVSIEQVNWGGGDLEVSGLDGELEIKSLDGDIILQDISGPVIISSTSGDVSAEFNGFPQGKPSAISIISGDIDLTLPSGANADFKLQSISGEIFTDFNLAVDKEKAENMHRIGGGYTINGSINGGGTTMTVNSISGDIYIRKKN